MKKLFGILLTSTLILGACSTHEDTTKKEDDTKSGMKSNDPNKNKSKDNKKDNDKKKSEDKSKKDDKNTNEENEKNSSQGKSSNNVQQTNEQPTQQTQTNQESQSQQSEQRYDYDHNGVYRTPAEQKAHEQWVNDQVEWSKQQEASQNNHVDLNSMPPGDFDPSWMSKSGQKQVENLANQKDSGQISQYEFNDRVSNVMNNEMDNQNN